jgi:NAD(P)H-dependent FMN reductase
MSQTLRILAFAGSARKDSINKKLVRAAAAAAIDASTVVTWIDLSDFSIPLYDGDLEAEQGQPAAALKLRELIKAHDALFIASPEYNGFFSPLLKNVLDWVSRPLDGEERHAAYLGKPVLLLSTTRGSSGGSRGLQHLRQLLVNLKAVPYRVEFLLPNGQDAFGAHGQLTADENQSRLYGTVRDFVGHIHGLQAKAA